MLSEYTLEAAVVMSPGGEVEPGTPGLEAETQPLSCCHIDVLPSGT